MSAKILEFERPQRNPVSDAQVGSNLQFPFWMACNPPLPPVCVRNAMELEAVIAQVKSWTALT